MFIYTYHTTPRILTSPSPFLSNDIPQLLPCQETPQIIRDKLLRVLRPAARRMGADNGIGRLPERRPGRQRLRLEDVEGGAANLALLERRGQRVLVDRGATAHVDNPRVPGELLQPLGVQGVPRALRAGEDHDEGVGLGQQLGEAVLAVDLDAVADAGGARQAAHLGAEEPQGRRQRLRDVAVAPDEDARVAERGEAVLGPVGLRAPQVLRPLPLQLVVAHLVEPARPVEEEAQGVLGHGAVVEAGPRGYFHRRREAGVQDVVRPRCEGLDPAQLRQPLGGVGEVLGAVGPGHEDLGVGVLLGDGRLDVIRVQGGREALEALDVELERCGV